MMYTTLAEHDVSHNSVFRKREEIADELLHEMESKLIYIKETQARVAEAASKSASKKK